MMREVRLYYLIEKDWRSLAEEIENHKNSQLRECVVIYDLTPSKIIQNYAVLSLCEEVDEMIEKHGGKEVDENDYMRTHLHELNLEPLFGEKSRIAFLKKLS